jgi:hypothetical protein
MGKGSTRRKEDTDKIISNWDAIFGKKDKTDDGQRKQPEALQQPPVRDSGDTSDGTHELLPR